MQVSVEQTGALERRLNIQVPASEVQAKIDERLREIGKTVRIKGFRPGKIPVSVLKQRYGQQVRQEVFAQSVQTSLQEALEQEAIRPVVQPRLDPAPDPNSDGDLQYTAIVEVFPEVESIDVASLELKLPESGVEEQDVDEMVETLREQKAEWSDVERAPAEGDQAVIDYVADTSDGRVPETGHHRLAVRLGTTALPELEVALKGMDVGSSKTVEISFPTGYGEAALAGQTCPVEVTLVEVKSCDLPEVDEAFVRSFGLESGDVDELRSEIRNNLDRELHQALTSMRKVRLVESLVESLPNLEVPDSLVRAEAQNLQAQNAQASPGGEMPPMEIFMPAAMNRVKAGLLLSELARQNDIRVDGGRVRSAIEALAATYEQPQEVMQLYYGDQQLLQRMENMVLEEQVVDWAMDHAKVSAEPMKFRDVIAGASQAG